MSVFSRFPQTISAFSVGAKMYRITVVSRWDDESGLINTRARDLNIDDMPTTCLILTHQQ
jgi:hypothetical protein